ncbi:hypothetical protein HQO42_10110 [Rhodococcus fascians]|nr:hypothetical protein [Rhodococcus fascians]MBY4237325.1 hypothetical protein [Rhodococcus fascians]MBY4253004.1 hypothetical protein [Rhodococcus fascians]MBY4268756.1 hypothetical protein [Rhodococcus fascians]
MTRAERIRSLVASGRDYDEIARIMGVTPGLAYLLATGMPADGGDTADAEHRNRPGFVPSRSQKLTNPEHHNPTRRSDVVDWARERAKTDVQMQRAAAEARP